MSTCFCTYSCVCVCIFSLCKIYEWLLIYHSLSWNNDPLTSRLPVGYLEGFLLSFLIPWQTHPATQVLPPRSGGSPSLPSPMSPSDRPQATDPKRKIPNQSSKLSFPSYRSQAKVPKLTAPSNKSQAEVPKLRSPTNVPKLKTPSEKSQVNPERTHPSEDPKLKIPS